MRDRENAGRETPCFARVAVKDSTTATGGLADVRRGE